jgi:hypothetical protein
LGGALEGSTGDVGGDFTNAGGSSSPESG